MVTTVKKENVVDASRSKHISLSLNIPFYLILNPFFGVELGEIRNKSLV